MAVVMRVEVDGDTVYDLRKIALNRKTTVPRLVADALRRDRVTKQAFQRKENTK